MAVAQKDEAAAQLKWAAALNVESGLYLLIGALALALRLFSLGDAPLSLAEAREALAAWRFVSASAIAPVQPTSAALHTLTSLSFLLFGASEFWARFLSALAGTAVAFAPMIFRREMGRGAALMACALSAISPVMLAASRAADGTTLAALSLLIVIAAIRRADRAPLLAGIGLGLGLASGPRFVSAAAASLLGLTMVVLNQPQIARSIREGIPTFRSQFWKMLAAAAVTFALFSTAGLLNPAGLSAAGAALPRWLAGWMLGGAARAPWLAPQMIFAYEPLLAVMGAGGLYVAFLSEYWHALIERVRQIFSARDPALEDTFAGRGAASLIWREAASAMGAMAVGAMAFAILYPGREAGDAVWVVVPLAMLAGKALAETFSGEWLEGERDTVISQAGALFVMVVFVYFNLAAYARGATTILNAPPDLNLYLALAVTALGVVVTILFAAGWSAQSAVRGAAIALGLATTIGTLGAGLALTQWRTGNPGELWTPTATQRDIRLMVSEIRHTSLRATGKAEDVEIAVVSSSPTDVRDGLLGWELRDFTRARYVDSLAGAANSPVVITTDGVSDPALGAAYVGDRFPAQSRPLQADVTARSFVNWWLHRNWPAEFSRAFDLWVRADIHALAANAVK